MLREAGRVTVMLCAIVLSVVRERTVVVRGERMITVVREGRRGPNQALDERSKSVVNFLLNGDVRSTNIGDLSELGSLNKLERGST